MPDRSLFQGVRQQMLFAGINSIGLGQAGGKIAQSVMNKN